jgi:hypothetical protein
METADQPICGGSARWWPATVQARVQRRKKGEVGHAVHRAHSAQAPVEARIHGGADSEGPRMPTPPHPQGASGQQLVAKVLQHIRLRHSLPEGNAHTSLQGQQISRYHDTHQCV